MGFALSQTISVPAEVRVVAYKHANGWIEFGLEHGGERVLPDSRFVSPNADAGRWYQSSPMTIEVEVPESEPIVTEDPVAEPQSPLSVRPSDHSDGLVCLEEADDAGSTWTWTDDGGEVTGFDTAFGVYTSGIQRGWAAALRLEGFPQGAYRDRQLRAAWHAQCASYHGIDLHLEGEQETDPDDWKNP